MRWSMSIFKSIRRKRVLRLFRTWDLRFHAKHLGEALAKPDDEFNRNYYRKKLSEEIHEICKKKNIRHDDLKLVETELNDYINGLVAQAREKEEQRQKTREFVETRIKIKGADKSAESDSASILESKPELRH